LTIAAKMRDVGWEMSEGSSFSVRPGDSARVSAALLAAERAWKRGDRAEALRWLQRASDAAREGDNERRAVELTERGAELVAQLRTPPPLPPNATPSAVHLLTKPKSKQRSTVPAPDEPDTGSRLPDFEHDQTRQIDVVQLGAEGTRRKTNAPKRKGSGPDIEEWEPETLSKADLSAALTAAQPPPVTRPRLPRSLQALRVRVWREPDGRLSLTPAGLPAPDHAVEAVLTALEPETDLTGLLDE
jgi:hypothetical protein